MTFWSRADACDHLEIEGRCPEKPGEVLMLAADAGDQTGAELGKPLPLADLRDRRGTQALGLPRPGLTEVVVVGTYVTPGPGDGWLIPSRLTSTNEQTTINGGYTPYSPAPADHDRRHRHRDGRLDGPGRHARSTCRPT